MCVSFHTRVAVHIATQIFVSKTQHAYRFVTSLNVWVPHQLEPYIDAHANLPVNDDNDGNNHNDDNNNHNDDNSNHNNENHEKDNWGNNNDKSSNNNNDENDNNNDKDNGENDNDKHENLPDVEGQLINSSILKAFDLLLCC